MAESFKYRKKAQGRDQAVPPFYVAVKSQNEVYFQMASLFKEVTKGEEALSGRWMDRILKSRASNSPGKFFPDNI